MKLTDAQCEIVHDHEQGWILVMKPKNLREAALALMRHCSARVDRSISLCVTGPVIAGALLFAPFSFGQGGDYFNVKHNSDYYKYRYDASYARPEQLLRTVENAHQKTGTEKIRAGLYQSAFHEFAFVLNVFPNHPEGLLGLDEVCRKIRSAGCSMELRFEKAIAVNPQAAGTYVIQGIHFSRTGKYPAAIESYKRAIELQPDSPVAHYNLGLAYADTKDYARANEHAQKAYALGFPLPGLREKLKKAGQWKPSEAPSASAPAAGAEAPGATTPGEQPAATAGGEKGPAQ